MNVLETLFRNIFFVIDNGIYFLVSSAYNLVTELSKTSILRRDVINDFAQRIYFFIAIFMLFKIAVSLINYFITPENFNDSKVGMGGVLKRIIVSLVLIVAVPVVFEQAYNLQQIVIEKNILASVFFGETSDEENAKRVFHDGGDIISIELFKAFFTPNKEEYDDTYDTATYVSDMQPLITKGSSGEYDYEYRLPLTSLAGGFAAWVLVMFCFDVAVRSIKLSFLQLIAPIPIISYIEPKKGDKIFNQWVSDCVSTYLSVFIRLVALYFVMYIIAELSANNWALFNLAGDSQVETSPLAYVFVILGLLLFMKEAPKLIMNILGIKDESGFTLNPLKKIKSSPYSAAALGAVGGFLGGTAANITAAIKNGNNPLEGAGSAVAGGFSGGFRGMIGGFTGKGGAVQGITDSSRARRLRAQGYGIPDRVGDWWTTVAGIPYKSGTVSQLKDVVNEKKIAAQNALEEKEQARNEFRDYRTNLHDASKSSEISRLLNQRISQGRGDDGRVKYVDSAGNSFEFSNNYNDYLNERAARLTAINNERQATQDADVIRRLDEEENIINSGLLDQNEYNQVISYVRMIDSAEGKSWLAEKEVKSAEERADLAKNKGKPAK